jgi:hypothetical protein
MSVLKFEIKNEHLLLLKHLRWSVNKDNVICAVNDEGDEIAPPFGEDSLYEAIDLILNGKPINFDPFNTEETFTYSDEQKAEWDKLYKELPLCLSIILQRQSFELGDFKSKWHDINWVKIK